MSKTIKTNSGHQFIIEGDIKVGNKIIVDVLPAEEFIFEGWVNDENITNISDDEHENRYEITILECSINFEGIFTSLRDKETCDKDKIHRDLYKLYFSSERKYDSEYIKSDITCDEIKEQLQVILGENENTL